ncbi:MAG TPA: chromosome segregation protein SMC [Gemmatimonadaceae bacterium]|nr:chromosome segregation protein SMC [Gemmatimonadaceae bacterium]
MRLTKLELHGFKSFADATELAFDSGVTAIVGPNGCGKSNVSDAVRWVLGEQRARLLRGAKMEEVIFQGSSARRPVNIAQVSLHFDNSDGELQIPFSEVVIARRLSRSGESEYLLNNTPCRLRDVHDLMRGTGLGADAGVVIEAKMIDALLSDRPDERRELFEEAAGVSLYRDRRRTTERRLEETSHDLQRLDDLLIEKTTLVRSLARQRKRAERHAELMQRRLAVELTLAEHDMAEWSDRLQALESELSSLRSGAPAAQERVSAAEAARDAARSERERSDVARTELSATVAGLREALANVEREIAVSDAEQRNTIERRRRAEAERELAAVAGARGQEELAAVVRDRERADGTVAAAQTALSERVAAEDAARGNVAAVRESLERTEQDVRGAREAMHRLELDRDGATRELDELAGRLTQLDEEAPPLRDQLADATGVVQSAEAAAQRSRDDASRADEAFAAGRDAAASARDAEAFARAALRDADDVLTALRAKAHALEQLERERVGLAPAAAQLLKERARFGDGAIIGPISDFVAAGAEAAALVERFLGATLHAVIVRDAGVADAVRAWHAETHPGALVLLPLDANPDAGTGGGDLASKISAQGDAGRWIRALLGRVTAVGDGAAFSDARGAIWLPGNTGGAGPLVRRAELVEIKNEVGRAEQSRSAASIAADAASAQRSAADATLRDAHSAVEAAARARHDAEARLAEAQSAAHRARRALADLDAQRARFEERRQALTTRLRDIDEETRALAARSDALAATAQTARAAVSAADAMLDEAREARTRAAVSHAEAIANRQVVVERQNRLDTERASHAEREDALVRELVALSAADEELARAQTSARLNLESRRADLNDAEARLLQTEEQVRSAGQSLVTAEHALDTARRDATEASDTLHRAELEHRDLAAKRSLVRERLEAEWRRPLEELYAGHQHVEAEPEALRTEAEDVRAQIDALGLVNPLAIEEHSEEQQRLEFLQRQRADLAEAQRSLTQAIREIDSTARDLFLQTFAKVQENFRHIFLTLFGGGECDLRLADPDAPLDCDIEIHASPRGKRTQRIHLLSSGERALVALSLLFGIFLTKPSPFCLLDEVDAPLDDANIGRYVRMLTEFKKHTQFIVITHNPRTTTEAADAVYGVTMQEPGVSSLVSVRMRGSPVDEPVETTAA